MSGSDVRNRCSYDGNSMNGLLKETCFDVLTSTQTYRPQNLKIYAKLVVESKSSVNKMHCLCLELVLFRTGVLNLLISS